MSATKVDHVARAIAEHGRERDERQRQLAYFLDANPSEWGLANTVPWYEGEIAYHQAVIDVLEALQ